MTSVIGIPSVSVLKCNMKYRQSGKVELFINYLINYINDFDHCCTGKLNRVKAPIVIGAHICTEEFFDGFMDTVRLFADAAL